MIAKPTDKFRKPRRGERGMVLIAVLMFIAMILPVTLLILDTVRIESLLPVNEAYSRTAGDEADKGFHEAVAAIMADQSGVLVDSSKDLAVPAGGPYFVGRESNIRAGKHRYDYLAEMWARHPDNDTIFLAERSIENWDGSDPDEHSVPVRWQLMNVPFGMDDFCEYYPDPGDHPRFLLPFEYVGRTVPLTTAERNAPAFYIDPSDLSMLSGDHEGDSPAGFASDVLTEYWRLPPTDPNYYLNIGNLSSILQFLPRPASYFRNTSGGPSNLNLANAELPGMETDIEPGFARENNDDLDQLVYDGLYDYNDLTTQYPLNMLVQQACTDSLWANKFFGSTGGSSSLTAAFVTTNKEYKPAPGSLTRYQLGSTEEDAVPGWHEAIVSDESGRFPINRLLNIIFASDNIDYHSINDDDDEPLARRDQFELNIDEVINNDRHPNHGGYLMARDILISLLMSDEDMARLAANWDDGVYQTYANKATWIIRQMLTRRLQLDESSDFNRNGDYSDDESHGEYFQYPEKNGNNDSDTLEIAAPGLDLLDGSGRLGDGQDLWDGTWRVFTNPKEIMTSFTGQVGNPLTPTDFDILNQRVTVYSMDTEHTADPQHPSLNLGPVNGLDVRHNIQHMGPQDDPNTPLQDESALWKYLQPIIGTARLQSIVIWREGLVDLNGDGDLDDEYIEQPVSGQRYDPGAGVYTDADDMPVSTLTYRERNNINFQDPQLAPQYIDPDMLNIRCLGDLVTIPMSAAEGLIVYSEAANSGDVPELVIKTENGADPAAGPVSLTTRSVYPDFSNAGAEVAYDNETNIYQNDISLANEVLVESTRLHPSWGPGDALMCYYNGDEIRLHDMGTGADSLALANADMPPDIDDTETETGGFWTDFTGNAIGDANFEMGSPDINPNGSYSEIAFTQVAAGSTGDEFLDPDVAYNIVSFNTNSTAIDILTDNDVGTFDYAPDFSSAGSLIAFTRTSYSTFADTNFLTLVLEALGADVDVPVTTIMVMDRAGGFPLSVQAEWDFGGVGAGTYIELDLSNFPVEIGVYMHEPMFPNFSPDGRSLVFMDVPVRFTVDTATDTITDMQIEASDIYRVNLGTDWSDWYRPWTDMVSIPAAPPVGVYEIFPDWGIGGIRIAQQNDTQIGTFPGTTLPLFNSPSTDSPFDEAERQTIAQEIGDASLALRKSIGWGADDQNWRLRDLPVMPEHVVDVLEGLADIVCFTDPYVMYDTQNPVVVPLPGLTVNAPPLQAYPGRVNINTATRPVLRSLLLLMFQGPLNDPDDDSDPNCPAPRIGDATGYQYINLMNPDMDGGSANDESRFKAMMVADRYAHQVCEYRKWIYNNEGNLGITDETVPSNLPLYEAQFAGSDPPVSHYGNYRANPFYPLGDTNGDTIAPELRSASPDPPFKSVAGLFSVMLYDDVAFPKDWTYEGIGGDGGPDDNDLPNPLDVDGNVTTNTLDALEVWGPIYNASDERWCTHPTGPLASGTMYGFQATVNNDPGDPSYNNFHEDQFFRLFSADDFRRISSWITVRTYDYRIESRGVVRIASGAQRTDITRDRIWIVTTNTDANFGSRLNDDTVFDVEMPLDSSFLAQNRGTKPYYVLYFEETPQSGLALTRDTFVPE